MSEMVWASNHFDSYDKPEQINAVIEKASEFFSSNLT